MFRHVYVHVPYCVKKCPYCDFFSVADDHRRPEFLDALEREFDLALDDIAHPLEVDTLFVGGGTPTHLPPGDVERLGRIIGDRVRVARGGEWTVEANPESATLDQLARFRDIGATRVSIGVQSLDPGDLAILGRPHAPADAFRAAEMVRATGFASWNVDLMFGIAGQTVESWQRTIELALSLGPPHLSAYALMIEPGSRFARGPRPDEHCAPDETVAAEYDGIQEALESAGYEHYEVSNYALPGHRCRHNEAYWDRHPYLGLGPSAHSFDGRRRWWNVRSIDGYLDRIARAERPVAGEEPIGPGEERAETIMLGLRRSRGIGWDELPAESRDAVADAVGPLVAHGLVAADATGIRLARTGWPVADAVVRAVLDAVERA